MSQSILNDRSELLLIKSIEKKSNTEWVNLIKHKKSEGFDSLCTIKLNKISVIFKKGIYIPYGLLFLLIRWSKYLKI